MAAAGDIQDLCEEATCSICLDYFTAPVTIVGCGHNFCRACLTEYWAEEVVAASCPQCRGAVRDRNLIPNRQLANFVEITKKLSLRGQAGAREAAGGVCEQHQEPLKLFCEDHQAPICVVCDRSKEHRNHKVIPLEEAFQGYKHQICSVLKSLRADKEKIVTYKADAETESQDLLSQTEEKRQKTVAAFRQAHQVLKEQEKSLLAQIDGAEKEIARRRDEHVAGLCKKISCLEKIIQEMERKCQQPASEFLQDIGRILQRYEEKETFENPVAFPPELTCRIGKFWDVTPLLDSAMKQIQDGVWQSCSHAEVDGSSGVMPAAWANVTLDPATAHPQLSLSKDCKKVIWGEEYQVLPDNPERFNYGPFVLGREGFRAGTHVWEVDVGTGREWAVGVARKSVCRKNSFCFSPEEGIWAVGKITGEYIAVNYPCSSSLSLSQKLKRIRVTLNCDEGQVVFSDAETGVHLYTYSGVSFGRETILPFLYVYSKTHLRLFP